MLIPIHSRFSFLYVRDEGPYAVRIENGRRPAAGFGHTAYRLFIPQPSPDLPGPVTDVVVPGSRHCDAENPTTLRAPLIGAHGGNEYRREFIERLGEWFGGRGD